MARQACFACDWIIAIATTSLTLPFVAAAALYGVRITAAFIFTDEELRGLVVLGQQSLKFFWFIFKGFVDTLLPPLREAMRAVLAEVR
jgi:hypothetical protein